MGLPVNYTCLYGAQQDGPVCSLLDIDGFNILLDCGWTDAFDLQHIQPLLDVAPHIDLVLLSHPDLQHAGALPYLVGRGGLRPGVPIYGTHPIATMGTMFLYDAFYAQQACSEFDLFSLDDVDAAFGRITKLKVLQAASLAQGGGLTLVPHGAGHLIGGVVWLLRKGAEVVLYGVHWNHKRERHLDGTQLETLATRPALLITRAAAAQRSAPQLAVRDEGLVGTLLGALRGGGSVLVPVDTAGRVLELLLVLDAAWAAQRLMYPLILVSAVAHSTLEFAAAQLEYMSRAVNDAFITRRDNPFTLKCVKVVLDPAEATALVRRGPAVVLASGSSLDRGLARRLLLAWGGEAGNLVLLPQPPREGTLAHMLLHPPGGQQQEHTLTVGTRVPLQGEELEAWEAARAAETAAQEGEEEEGEPGGAGGGLGPQRANVGSISKLVRATSGGVLMQVRQEASEEDLWGDSPAAGGAEGVLCEGFIRPAAALYPMFADEGEGGGVEWSKYGLVDEGLLNAIRSAASQSNTEVLQQLEEAEEELDRYEPPTKVVTTTATFRCLAQVSMVDFSGLADGHSVASILSNMAPRQLVLLGGTPPATAAMAAAAQQALAKYQAAVYTPGPRQVVPLSLTRSLEVKLQEALLASLTTHTLGQYTLAWCDGTLAAAAAAAAAAPTDGTGAPEEGDGDNNGAGGSEPEVALELVPAVRDQEDADMAMGDEAGGYTGVLGDHGGIFIGDVKLSEVKQALAAAGIASEFRAGGVLVCAGVVRVRRGEGGEGQLLMEGPLCDMYYAVRDVVYGQYNIC